MPNQGAAFGRPPDCLTAGLRGFKTLIHARGRRVFQGGTGVLKPHRGAPESADRRAPSAATEKEEPVKRTTDPFSLIDADGNVGWHLGNGVGLYPHGDGDAHSDKRMSEQSPRRNCSAKRHDQEPDYA